MRRFILTWLVLAVLAVPHPVVHGHQPWLVPATDTLVIEKPEISQAFYAELPGHPQHYRIQADGDFVLHLSLLVPDLPGARTDFQVTVEHQDAHGGATALLGLDGREHSWVPFYEPFGGDDYLEGPAWEGRVPPGTYLITVVNPDNRGKYVLSVGKEESFTLAELVTTLRRMPAVKRFFDKSPWTAFFNLLGLFLLLALLVTGAIVWLGWRLIRTRLRS